MSSYVCVRGLYLPSECSLQLSIRVSLLSSNEPVPSTGNSRQGSSFDPSSLPNASSSGTTSHGPYKDLSALEIEDVASNLCKEQGDLRAQGENGFPMTINILPDDILLEIFDLCRQDAIFSWFSVWGHGLVHVCQRWRRLVFGSPRRLDLQLHCTRGSPVRKMLSCWPPFFITIFFREHNGFAPNDEDGLFAALGHPDRARQVDLSLTTPLLEKVFMVMQHQLSVLTHLTLAWDDDGSPPAIPSGFLGGSAPCLQHIRLDSIPFPALPTLLSTTYDLVHLYVHDITQEGYISLGAMITCLAALPKLEFLHIGFNWATSHPDRLCLTPLPRILLPALTFFEFHGVSTYLEELISRIDSPRLKKINIRYSHRPFDIQVTQLFQFIDRSEVPKLTLIRHAYVNISRHRVVLDLYSCSGSHPGRGLHGVSIVTHCRGFNEQNSYLALLLGQPSALFSRVVHLKLHRHRADEDRYNDEWLHVLRRFSAARTLHVLSGNFAGDVILTLEDLTGEMVAEVLPVLDLIYIGEQPTSCMEKFLAARQLSGRPVTMVKTKVEFSERVKSYVDE